VNCVEHFSLWPVEKNWIFFSLFAFSMQLSEDCVDLFDEMFFLVELPSKILMGMQILGLMALDINKFAEVIDLKDKILIEAGISAFF